MSIAPKGLCCSNISVQPTDTLIEQLVWVCKSRNMRHWIFVLSRVVGILLICSVISYQFYKRDTLLIKYPVLVLAHLDVPNFLVIWESKFSCVHFYPLITGPLYLPVFTPQPQASMWHTANFNLCYTTKEVWFERKHYI